MRQGPAAGRSANAPDYRRSLIERAHQLIAIGYERLNPAESRTAAEPEITGILVAAIREVFDDPASAEWVDHFDVHDDPPVDDGLRRGKHRSRLDIKFVSAKHRPRQAFSFEAKRLDQRHSSGAYLGAEGLGCFLSGKYARDEEDAGMLGYVQSDGRSDWAARIGQKLEEEPQRYAVLAGGSWHRHHLADGPDHCYRSRHSRRSLKQPIDVYHTLLSFR